MMNKLLQSIPFSRLVIYIVLLTLFPVFGIGFLYLKEKNTWNEVAEQILTVHSLSEQKARKQSMNTTVRKKYAKADDFYLDNQVETINFLKKEREALENLVQNPTFTGNELAERRYAFLSGEANRLQFTQGAVQGAEGVQETTVILAHPVEVDNQDLKELLMRVEGNRPKKPQLLITDFKLNKKAHSNGNEVFEVNMKLLKREFAQ